ncbi:hypothetical protein [Nonomuraea longicatena]|uniref:Lipoprotein n=1 Tax=Nonomuraea longicatena TaxID=83682 RepID=A0ABP3ZNT7_9ACTN
MRLTLVVLALAVGCTAVPVEGDPAAGLRRAWEQPMLAPGATCPVSTTTATPDPDTAPVLGGGPAGPITSARVEYYAPSEGNLLKTLDWGAQKVAWAVDPTVTEPVLVRGRRIDAPGRLGFDDPVVRELLLDPVTDASPGGWRQYPSLTRVRAPGCYAYQVDLSLGSHTIVVRAVGPVV